MISSYNRDIDAERSRISGDISKVWKPISSRLDDNAMAKRAINYRQSAKRMKTLKKYDMSKLDLASIDFEKQVRQFGDELAKEDIAGDLADIAGGAIQEAKDLAGMNEKSIRASKDNILEAIFKIVPIGLNVVAKFPVIFSGLVDVVMSVKQFVQNMAALIVRLFRDNFVFWGRFMSAGMHGLNCFLEKIYVFPFCVLFYAFDLFIGLVYLIICSILFLVDTILFIKVTWGMGLLDALFILQQYITDIDTMIYDTSGLHILQYPDIITRKCYRCGREMDYNPFYAARNALFNDVFVYAPKQISQPFGQFFGGLGKIFSFFAIDNNLGSGIFGSLIDGAKKLAEKAKKAIVDTANKAKKAITGVAKKAESAIKKGATKAISAVAKAPIGKAFAKIAPKKKKR